MATRRRTPGRSAERIAVIAPPWYPLPPRGYGGIELVVWLLVRELRARGHSVLAFGGEGSGEGVRELAPQRWSTNLGSPSGGARELTYLARVFAALRRSGPVDVIHDHSGFAGALGSSLLGLAPVVHTVHGPLGEVQRTFYEALGGRVGLIAISDHQRSTGPGLDWVATVHNAVDLSSLRVGTPREKERYLLCLARICPDKGQHTAIEVARRAGYRLVLAGKVEATPEGRHYYQTQVQPFVDNDRVVHVVNAAGAHKADLLARATALLAPIAWEEPFGLSVVEAMASGTPAISFARGAAPELIDHGRTGFLVDGVDAMVQAVRAAPALDGVRCAAHARGRFNAAAMVDGYRRTYRSILGASAPEAEPEGRLAEAPLLEGAIA